MTTVCVTPWRRAHGNVLVLSNVELTSKIRIWNILNAKGLATAKHSGEWGCSRKCGLLFVLISWSVCLPLEAEIIPAFPVSGAAGLCQLHGVAIPAVKLMQMMVNSCSPLNFWVPVSQVLQDGGVGQQLPFPKFSYPRTWHSSRSWTPSGREAWEEYPSFWYASPQGNGNWQIQSISLNWNDFQRCGESSSKGCMVFSFTSLSSKSKAFCSPSACTDKRRKAQSFCPGLMSDTSCWDQHRAGSGGFEECISDRKSKIMTKIVKLQGPKDLLWANRFGDSSGPNWQFWGNF